MRGTLSVSNSPYYCTVEAKCRYYGSSFGIITDWRFELGNFTDNNSTMIGKFPVLASLKS